MDVSTEGFDTLLLPCHAWHHSPWDADTISATLYFLVFAPLPKLPDQSTSCNKSTNRDQSSNCNQSSDCVAIITVIV